MSSDLELRKTFNFDEIDLIANRKGQVTQKQEKFLKQSQITGKMISVLLGFLILIGGASRIPGIINDYIRFGFYNRSIGGVVFILVMIAFALLFLRGLFTKKNFSVETVKGKVSFIVVKKNTKRQYQLHIGNENFDVGEELPKIINEGDMYSFYYTADTHHILSCEFVSKG